MSNCSVRSSDISNIMTVQYHISKEKRKDWILPAPATISIKFTRILPVPVWPDMSSPAQSFASDMKSPSGRPPSGFWPWQQNFSCSLKIQCFIWLMKYLVRNCNLAINIINDHWSFMNLFHPFLPVISVFLPPPGFSSAPLGLTHSGAEKWWKRLA